MKIIKVAEIEFKYWHLGLQYYRQRKTRNASLSKGIINGIIHRHQHKSQSILESVGVHMKWKTPQGNT